MAELAIRDRLDTDLGTLVAVEARDLLNLGKNRA